MIAALVHELSHTVRRKKHLDESFDCVDEYFIEPLFPMTRLLLFSIQARLIVFFWSDQILSVRNVTISHTEV